MCACGCNTARRVQLNGDGGDGGDASATRYEGVISKALKAGEGTKALNVTLIDQGVNGGTVTDLVAGFSPWYEHARSGRVRENPVGA